MMKYVVRDMFVAGTETLASTVTWAVLILCNRQNTVLKKVRNLL